MVNIINIFRNPLFWLALIIILGFAVRLYKIDNPIADWHSWRQADTAAVARSFYQEGYNPFIPRYDDMSAVSDNPTQNPHRYRFVEFPIYNSLVYFSYLINGGVDERLARLISIIFSLGSTLFIYFIVRRHWNTFTALLSSLVFAVLPFNIFFSRVILPEPTLVFFSLGMFYFIDRWISENTQRLFVIGIFFTICAFLIKPTAGFYLLPLIYSYRVKEGRWWPVPKRYVYFLIVSLTPFFLWRVWMSFFPEGIPAGKWLFNGDGIRFRPAFWKWIIGDRFGREILTVTGSVLFFIGLLVKPLAPESKVLHLLALSSLGFLIVFATGNVRHDYYQTLIIPALAIFTARGFTLLASGFKSFIPRIFTIPFAFLFLSLTFYFGWNEVKGLYQVNNWAIVEEGRKADKILPKEAVVLAPYDGDTAFLYQINRPGWPNKQRTIDDLKNFYGLTHYVSINYDSLTKEMMERYTVLEATPKLVVVDLRKENLNYIDNIKPLLPKKTK